MMPAATSCSAPVRAMTQSPCLYSRLHHAAVSEGACQLWHWHVGPRGWSICESPSACSCTSPCMVWCCPELDRHASSSGTAACRYMTIQAGHGRPRLVNHGFWHIAVHEGAAFELSLALRADAACKVGSRLPCSHDHNVLSAARCALLQWPFAQVKLLHPWHPLSLHAHSRTQQHLWPWRP